MTQVLGEYGMSDQAFRHIAQIAVSDAGLSIPESKKALVLSRLSRRLRVLGLESVNDYLTILEDAAHVAERKELISILTTNVSNFYREEHHFRHLVENLFPILREKFRQKQDVRLWSCGCSSGQEPYTIGIELAKKFTKEELKHILILATDIDPAILEKARAGIYSRTEVDAVPQADRRTFFSESEQGHHINTQVRELVRFRELNLHAHWPMKGQFDAIFCRNVLIYFDDAHQRALWPRFRGALTSGGYLYLGHSERIHPLENSGFISLGATVYQKSS